MVFIGGLCVLGVNVGGLLYGVFMVWLGVLMQDFFVNLLDMCMKWCCLVVLFYVIEGCDCKIGEVKWMGMVVDLVFGFNLQLCVIVEVLGLSDVYVVFVCDFVVVWVKVMNVDCFDLCG